METFENKSYFEQYRDDLIKLFTLKKDSLNITMITN